MNYKQRDIDFKVSFHKKRNQLFLAQSLNELRDAINSMLDMNMQNDMKEIYYPMPNWESVQLELSFMLYGISKWESIKLHLLQFGMTKQTDLIKAYELDKDKISLFLYRISQFGIVKKEKIGSRNAYQFASDTIDTAAMAEEWTILWEEPYKIRNGVYTEFAAKSNHA